MHVNKLLIFIVLSAFPVCGCSGSWCVLSLLNGQQRTGIPCSHCHFGGAEETSNQLSYSEVFEQGFCTTLDAQDQNRNKTTKLDMVSSQLQPNVVGVSIWKLLRPASICAWKCPKLCPSPELTQKFIVLLAYQNQDIRIHPELSMAARKISQKHYFLFTSALKDGSGASLLFVQFFN